MGTNPFDYTPSEWEVDEHNNELYFSTPDGKPMEFRQFDTGANRDTDEGKYDYEGHICPLALEAFAEYMNKNRHLKDGTIRDSDNWQKGMSDDVYLKSLLRHVMDVWLIHRGYDAREDKQSALCGAMFNIQGLLHNHMRKDYGV